MAPQPAAIPKGLESTGNRGLILKEPYGATLVIGPFNAPILLLLDPAIAALAAGNTVVLKPANTTPATAALFQKVRASVFRARECRCHDWWARGDCRSARLTLRLHLLHREFRRRQDCDACGGREPDASGSGAGRPEPTIVDETANLDIAADRIAWGHNAISGQWCIAPGYVYVHESVADAFIARLKASIVRMYGEDPQQSPDFARMISEHDAQRVASYIVPWKVVHGGRFDIKARYVEPTVLYPSTWDDPALQQEVFGPVLPVMPNTDLKEIVGIMKRKPKSLAAYVFSKSQANIDYVLGRLSFGGGCVNQTTCIAGSAVCRSVGSATAAWANTTARPASMRSATPRRC